MHSAWDMLAGQEQGDDNDDFLETTDDEGGDEDEGSEPTNTESVPSEPAATTETTTEVPAEDGFDDSFLPEDLRVGTYESPEQELDQYRNAYKNIVKKFASPEGLDNIVSLYEKNLIEADERLAKDAEEFLAFRANKEDYVRANIPQLAIEAGLPMVPDDETVANTIHETMAAKYGEGWQDMYNEFDRFKTGSISQKIMTDYEKMQAAANAHVQEMKTKYQEHVRQLTERKAGKVGGEGLTQQNLESIIEQEFKVFEANGITREEYQRYVEEAKKSELRLYDVYRAQNFDKLIDTEKAKWKEEGKKEYLASLKKAGRMAEVKAGEVPKPKARAERPQAFDKSEYYRQQEKSLYD